MKPSDSFIEYVKDIYPGKRGNGVLNQLDDAQMSVGFRTLVHELSDERKFPTYHFVIWEPTQASRVEVLQIGEYLIGRAPQCRIVLEHCGAISRVHCLVIVHSDKRVTIRDLNSRNGTFVNGVLLWPQGSYDLEINDQIRLSETTMTLLWG